MKILISIAFVFVMNSSNAQIKHIASYDADWNISSLFGASDNSVYHYSIFYEEWFPLPNTGLPVINGNVNIKAIAVADTGTSYTSGIYVIADTAVFEYSWYYDDWYALSNTGLNRQNNVVLLEDISAHGKGSSTDHTIFAVSGGEVFEYGWYTYTWYPLVMTGTGTKVVKNNNNEFYNYPNPYKTGTTFKYDFETPFSGKIELVVYSQTGKVVDIIEKDMKSIKTFEYKYPKNLPSGLYFCELKYSKRKYVTKMLVE